MPRSGKSNKLIRSEKLPVTPQILGVESVNRKDISPESAPTSPQVIIAMFRPAMMKMIMTCEDDDER